MLLLAGALIASGAPCFAIDNPDAPDYIREFEARSGKFDEKLREQGRNTRDTTEAYAEYERFLEHELNRAYAALVKSVAAEPRKRLVQSQRRWIQYRDAEFSFIGENWTVERFGTSSAISRGAYRATIIKDRTVTLLHYLKNYRPQPR
jgi:uncharacterized protein YecT (DUF1311 family)